MRKTLFAISIFALLFGLFLTEGRAQETTTPSPPPLSQPLVREGDFAVKLAEKLNLEKPLDEVDAESKLTAADIAPRNGWIANYPVTPDILDELRNAVAEASEAGRIPIKKDEALRVFESAVREAGLPIVAISENEVAKAPPPPPSEPPPPDDRSFYYGEYADPGVVEGYYYEAGPPVVTYYPPPWDYYYLYAWVPFPFWCGGFYFPGYFILHDFSTLVVYDRRVVVVSNHYFDRWSGRIHRIDPVTRHSWRDLGWKEDAFRSRWTHSRDAREGASSIYRRSLERRPPAQSGPHEGKRSFERRELERSRPMDRGAVSRDRFERRDPRRSDSSPPRSLPREGGPKQAQTNRSPRRDWPDIGPGQKERAPSNVPAPGPRERSGGPPSSWGNRPADRGRFFESNRSYDRGNPSPGRPSFDRMPSPGAGGFIQPPAQGGLRSPGPRGGGFFGAPHGGGGLGRGGSVAPQGRGGIFRGGF